MKPHIKFIISEYTSQAMDGIERLWSILDTIRRHREIIEKNRERIHSSLTRVNALKTGVKGHFVIIDPTNRFFLVVSIAPLLSYKKTPEIFYIEMKPPLIPHFFLISSYFALELNLVPAGVIRVEPVLSLISLLTVGDDVIATVTQASAGAFLWEPFFKGEVSLLPPDIRFLEMPIEPDEKDVLYLTGLGYSTRPINKDFNVRIDFSEIPTLPNGLASEANIKPATEIIKEIAGELRNEYWSE